MKKLVSLITLVIVLLLPVNPLLAATNSPGFFEALGNMANLKDHKQVQSFYGHAELEEMEDHLSIRYRLTFNTVLDEGSRTDTFTRVNAFFKVYNHKSPSSDTPFKEMTVQANGEVITKGQDDLFFKLSGLNIGTKQAEPSMTVDVGNAMAMADMYRGTWFHTSASDLSQGEFDKAPFDNEEIMALKEQLKEDPKEAIMDFTEMGLQNANENFSEGETQQFLDVMELILNADIFTVRDIVAGRNSGFKFFNLNRGAVIDLLENVAEAFGEEMSDDDEDEIRDILGKFNLSGIYRMDPVERIMDNLLVRFKLRDTGPISNFEMNYRSKIWDIGNETSIMTPTNYKEWDESSF